MTTPDPEPDTGLLPAMEHEVWQGLAAPVRARLIATARRMVEENPLLNVEAALQQLIRAGVAGRSYQEYGRRGAGR